MNETAIFWKEIGETPLQCLERFRLENPKYRQEKISYAGRLDPMAEGQMLFLIGLANHEREKYMNLDKEYTFQILFGISTDSLDILGKVNNFAGQETNSTREQILETLPQFLGKRKQKYPWFSSKTVNGKALWESFREGLTNIERPEREIEIYSLELEKLETISKADLQRQITEKTSLVNGDFRQDEIFAIWDKYFVDTSLENYQVAELKVKCSSGTYVRTLVEEIGESLKIPTLALSIMRSQILI